MLELSKIEAGKFALSRETIRVGAVLANVCSMMHERVAAKRLELITEVRGVPARLLGDSTRLQQALLNYVTNAVKFTEKGEIVVRVAVDAQDGRRATIRVSVSDTGIGIAPEKQAHIFDAFAQEDTSTTRKYGGTGLGLAITRRLAELMGGETGADSMPGAGSTFWFTVNLKKMTERRKAAHLEKTETEDAEKLLKQRYSGQRILVVDDDPINREVALMQLEAADLIVDTAEDGAEAVTLARKKSYAAIFMDMQMPIRNGVEATKEIRQLPGHRDTPIIAMTANAFAEDKASCFDAGMNDFTTKPVSYTHLTLPTSDLV